MNSHVEQNRTIGLLGATSLGVGAIVGGGILALAGVAFASAGPSAIVAFALNGIIALLAISSFSEMSTTFPESGGTYTFAKRVLTIRAAFGVGWIVWFASILAAVLYALGFAAYAILLLRELLTQLDQPLALLDNYSTVLGLALLPVLLYSVSLIRRGASGGQWETVGKVVVFAILIVGGLWALGQRSTSEIVLSLSPFFSGGTVGVLQAMGFSFIALQGYDLVAAVAGEVREPTRVLPRAMLLSLAIAMGIYLPLLFVVSTVGIEAGQTIQSMGARDPETVIASAALNFLGPTGFWLVVIAATLSMLSALHANLFAASRVALAMARDRTLPHAIANGNGGTPVAAICLTGLSVVVIIIAIPNLAAAGAAASLIFLITFALVHVATILARKRMSSDTEGYRAPFFPIIPVVGAVACTSLAVFQGVAVPSAGLITVSWLAIGGVLFLVLFARRAHIVDAAAEATDPYLIQLRGKSPLILVPIANPANAAAMVGVANALSPPGIGRVMMLSVVPPPERWEPGESPQQLIDAEAVIRESLVASFAANLAPEALITVSPVPLSEIGRVSREHRCAGILLGMSQITEQNVGAPLEDLISSVDCDVALLRFQPGWDLSQVRRVVVPVGGHGTHDIQRARFLGSLRRNQHPEIVFLRVLPTNASDAEIRRARNEVNRIAHDKAPGSTAIVSLNDSVADEIKRQVDTCDLAVLGLQRIDRRRRAFGDLAIQIARDTACATVMLSQRG